MHIRLYVSFCLISVALTASSAIVADSRVKSPCDDTQESCEVYRTRSNPKQITTTSSSSTTTRENNAYLNFSRSLKVAAFTIAGIALFLGIVRLCLVIYQRPSRRQRSRTSTIRPQVATISTNHFKPDLPPNYREAVAHPPDDRYKLPSYHELQILPPANSPEYQP